MWQQLLAGLPQGAQALSIVGMPRAHEAAFRRAARQQRCVLSSRELGRVGTGLVEEGYDSKGFRIKSKTCNFGPMAGFVCANPNYSKKGVAYAAKQQQDINHALLDDDHVGWRAGLEQICISDARLQWLAGEPSVRVAPQPSVDRTLRWGFIGQPAAVWWVARLQPHRVTRELVWHLYEAPDGRVVRLPWSSLKAKLKPLMALTNPHPAYAIGHYKNCVCGDYDLFGVWPLRADYNPQGEDRRIAGMRAGPADARNQQIFRFEDRRLGNISDRVSTVGQIVNSLLPRAPGATGGIRDMIHHSDEGGRPMVSEIELPIIAFIPGPQSRDYVVAVRTIGQMRNLVLACSVLGFQVVLNAGWGRQLGAFQTLGDLGDGRGWQTPANSPVRSS